MKKWIITIFVIIIIIISTIIIFINHSEGNNENISDNKSYDIKISNREIELAMIRDENIIENDKSFETISNEIFEEKVLDMEREKREICLDSEQEENLKNVIYNNPISDENKLKLKDMDMTEEEFRDYLYERMIKMQKRVQLNKQLLEEINNNDIKIDDEEFKAEVKKFNEDKNNFNNTESLLTEYQDLYDSYVELISQQYNKIEE